MNYEIQNLTRRLVSVHCNSGKTCHLPPGKSFEVPEQEISGNPSVDKLKKRKLIETRKAPKAAGAKSAPEKTTKAGARPKRAGSSKKAARKKAPARKKSRSNK